VRLAFLEEYRRQLGVLGWSSFLFGGLCVDDSTVLLARGGRLSAKLLLLRVQHAREGHSVLLSLGKGKRKRLRRVRIDVVVRSLSRQHQRNLLVQSRHEQVLVQRGSFVLIRSLLTRHGVFEVTALAAGCLMLLEFLRLHLSLTLQ